MRAESGRRAKRLAGLFSDRRWRQDRRIQPGGRAEPNPGSARSAGLQLARQAAAQAGPKSALAGPARSVWHGSPADGELRDEPSGRAARPEAGRQHELELAGAEGRELWPDKSRARPRSQAAPKRSEARLHKATSAAGRAPGGGARAAAGGRCRLGAALGPQRDRRATRAASNR